MKPKIHTTSTWPKYTRKQNPASCAFASKNKRLDLDALRFHRDGCRIAISGRQLAHEISFDRFVFLAATGDHWSGGFVQPYFHGSRRNRKAQAQAFQDRFLDCPEPVEILQPA